MIVTQKNKENVKYFTALRKKRKKSNGSSIIFKLKKKLFRLLESRSSFSSIAK